MENEHADITKLLGTVRGFGRYSKLRGKRRRLCN
jgi:hypothetical protein